MPGIINNNVQRNWQNVNRIKVANSSGKYLVLYTLKADFIGLSCVLPKLSLKCKNEMAKLIAVKLAIHKIIIPSTLIS